MPVVIEDLIDGILGGTGWGFGLIAVAAAAAVGAPKAKPIAKQAIKGYLAVTERARGALAEASEQLQDIYAEAKHEYESQLAAAPAQEIVLATNDEPVERTTRRGAGSGLVTPAGQPA